MDWQTRMLRAIEYLEGCLTADWDPAEAGQRANCSPFHFMRMFEVITGISPAEYLRRRRLSAAALDLSGGSEKVLDVSLNYGWDSPDAFARAFKKEFGCLPSEARQNGARLHIYPPLAFTIALKGDKAMEYRIEQTGEIRMTGLSRRFNSLDGSNFKEIPLFWEEVMKTDVCDRLWKASKQESLGVVGVCYDHDMKTGEFSYAIAIETPEDLTLLPEGCVDILVPASTWAKFTSRGPLHPNFQETIKRIYSEWFPASGREHAGTHEIEYYGTHPDSASPDYWAEYWVPLK